MAPGFYAFKQQHTSISQHFRAQKNLKILLPPSKRWSVVVSSLH